MCIPTKLQQNIVSLTKDGHAIAQFLVNTMQGETPGVKVCHRMEATKHLIKYGFPDTECETTSDRLSRAGGNPERQGEGGINTPSPSTGEGWDGGDNTTHPVHPVTHLDILNYQIAHLIRHETAEGHTVVNFLVDIMTGRDRPFTPKKFRIKPADRMAAARELLRRGFGDLGSRRKQSDITDEANAYDTLHTDLAKRMREYSERGTDTIRFLLELMSDPDPDKEFTVHHRMYAAQELLRRGWDTNYDNIKPKHLQAYWQDKESTRLSIGQKKTQAGLPTSIDDYDNYDNYDNTDYEAIAKEIREEEDRDDNSKPLRFQETVPSSPHSSESRNLEDRQTASPSTMLPLPQGEGWGEGSAGILKNPLPPRRGKARACPELAEGMGVNSPAQSPLPNKAITVNEQDKAIIKEFQEAMASGDHRAALRAEAKYRRIDIKSEKNIYDYGPNDPDPTIDYYFEPLSPEAPGKVRRRRQTRTRPNRRRDHRFHKHARSAWHVRPLRAACPNRRRPQHTHPPQSARHRAQNPHHPQP